MNKLGKIQELVLRTLADHGWWGEGQNWLWDTHSGTTRLLESLTKKGLANKVNLPHPWNPNVFRYEISDAGLKYLADQDRRYPPLHMRFGYAIIMEKDAIRERLISEGVTDQVKLFHAVERAYEEAHKNDKSMRERQEEARRAREQKWREEEAKKPRPPRATQFTAEELMYLLERYGQANDPVAAAIGQKAKETLMACGRLPEQE